MDDIIRINLRDRDIVYSGGECFSAEIPELKNYSDNQTTSYRSSGVLYEDGKVVGKSHVPYESVQKLGKGRFVHWESTLNFSSSDNTSPLENGREYIFELDKSSPSYKAKVKVIDEQTGLLDMPQLLQLVMTNSCNLNCRICRPEDFQYTKTFQNRETLENIVDQLFDYLSYLRLDSGGELFLNKELPFVLSEAEKRGIGIFISTNGMLLNDKNIEILMQSSVEKMQISFDSADKETLEWIRHKADFDKITSNIQNLVARNRENGKKLLINMHAAIFKQNIDHLPDLVRLAASLGIDGITYSFGFCHSYMKPEWSPLWHKQRCLDSVGEAFELSKELGIDLNGPRDFKGNPAQEFCSYLFKKTYINENGEIWPCCLGSCSIGNINEINFRELWHGEKYRKLRESYNTGDPYWYKCGKCSMTKGFDPDDPEIFFAPEHWDTVKKMKESL
jgi:radical SAM protein with 4Fe4S-binding SPASM domain